MRPGSTHAVREPEQPLRVLVVEDSATVRAHIRSVLDADPGLTVVGEAPDGQRAIAQCLELRPDVISMDMMMPELSGLAVVNCDLSRTDSAGNNLADRDFVPRPLGGRALLEGSVEYRFPILNPQRGYRLLPVFVEHEFWRPRERAWLGSTMRSADVARLRQELENGVRMAQSLGLDVSGVELPRLAA